MEHAGDPTATNRTAIVTGAASGIGRALAEALAEAGVEVVLADRQTELAAEVASGICTRAGVAIAAELDVRDADRFRDLVKSTVARTGRLDYLFNNAGIGVGGEMKEFGPADWDDVIDVNLRGVAYGILAAYPVMIRQGFGHIVNTASMAGLAPAPFQISYTATKHAVVGLSRALRLEAKQYGVRVSVLCPGLIRTPILTGGRYGRSKGGFDAEAAAANVERLRPMEPSRFARRALRAIERNRAIIIEPAWWRIVWYLDRLSPWLMEKFGDRVMRDAQRGVEAARSRAR